MAEQMEFYKEIGEEMKQAVEEEEGEREETADFDGMKTKHG